MFNYIKRLIIGDPKNPLDPSIFRHVSLIAFFAWVGLGSDGMSSSCYGPEEAFLHLGGHMYLAIYLAIAVAATVFILTISYSQLIEIFPTGGSGYLVATKLLGPYPGLVSGCALVIDYVLTIAISIAGCTDAVFSLLPPEYQMWKLPLAITVIIFLTLLNLRGVKESVLILTPIFLAFVGTHVVLLFYGIFSHGSELPALVTDTVAQTKTGIEAIGLWAMILILLKAYSMGAGTFTGIEAVSDGLEILREPRVITGKKTLRYMAISLAFVAGGILINYVLNDVTPVAGRTLNASLFASLTASWPGGAAFFWVTMASEGAILLVAAQTGFLGGPRILANMALDSWVPKRFTDLSERLVIQDAVIFMSTMAIAAIIYSKGSVKTLIIMYSINVFLTFSLSQIGMCRYWLKNKEKYEDWVKKFLVNAVAGVVTVSILIATSILKFMDGGWVTLVITAAFLVLCLFINRRYNAVGRALKHLDQILGNLSLPKKPTLPQKDPKAPTAVLLVDGFNGKGIHSFLAIHRFFPNHFKNFVFVSTGVINSDRFKGVFEIENLKKSVEKDLANYIEVANKTGFYAETAYTLGTDTIDELEEICSTIAKKWSRRVFFTGQLVFEKQSLWTRVLHNQTSFAIQRRLLFNGYQSVILPIRVHIKK
ncbi:APC family permease [Elusimicrobiota bacterium]